ncbi:MAG: hypothetical protein RLZZ196_254 [Bacteroidota bacterium]|jgi:hypothetical protein
MKKLTVILLPLVLCACNPAPVQSVAMAETVVAEKPEGCVLETASNLVNQNEVGPITNLVKTKSRTGVDGTCQVDFDLTVNGVTHHLTESETGYEQLESLCYYARERARKNLLLDLGGDFKTESTVTCRTKESIG